LKSAGAAWLIAQAGDRFDDFIVNFVRGIPSRGFRQREREPQAQTARWNVASLKIAITD
jgi:hypothetical protein